MPPPTRRPSPHPDSNGVRAACTRLAPVYRLFFWASKAAFVFPVLGGRWARAARTVEHHPARSRRCSTRAVLVDTASSSAPARPSSAPYFTPRTLNVDDTILSSTIQDFPGSEERAVREHTA
ncbi:hypothetical protein DFH08DRAFT_971141 [Mycena albidolilacea]|uniref:Uncharacterized protein n=1 Tax=Mycena albidolilacea TaxID=1033008 RepID=A0AAD6ZEH0_9AGAR|nr:hypothetical protein DFH08DRAFT_971141 [Mycena albidolilacea]